MKLPTRLATAVVSWSVFHIYATPFLNKTSVKTSCPLSMIYATENKFVLRSGMMSVSCRINCLRFSPFSTAIRMSPIPVISDTALLARLSELVVFVVNRSSCEDMCDVAPLSRHHFVTQIEMRREICS
jgi:hypothetical protein